MSKTNKTLGQLKGSVSQDFQPTFFHDSNPSRPLINRRIYFRIRFRFRRDIRIFKKLRGVHYLRRFSIKQSRKTLQVRKLEKRTFSNPI